MVAEEGDESKHSNDNPFESLHVVGDRLPGDEDPQKAGVVGGKKPGHSGNRMDNGVSENVDGVTETPVSIDVRVNVVFGVGKIVINVHHPVVQVELLEPEHRAKNRHGTCNGEGGQLLLVKSGNGWIRSSLHAVCNSKNVSV